MWVALLHCDRDGNSPWTLLSAAFSAPGLGSEPSSATACLSVLNEARCANREVPGHCWLTLHRAAGQGGGARAGVGGALLASSAHPDTPGRAGIPGFPGQGARGGTACAPEHGPRGLRARGAVGCRGSPRSEACRPWLCRPGRPQTVRTGMCSGAGWPQDGGLVPSWRPRGWIQWAQLGEDRVAILRFSLRVSEVGGQRGYPERE